MYALYFMLVTITCVIMMSPTVEMQMRDNVSSSGLLDILLPSPPVTRHSLSTCCSLIHD